MPWAKGQSGNPSGRPKGCQNKVTRAAKEFLTSLIEDPEVQDAVRARVLAGDTAGFFKAVEQIQGKPKQQIEATINGGYVLPAGDDVAESD